MDEAERIYGFWLCSTLLLGRKKRRSLLEYFGSATEVFHGKKEQFFRINALQEKDIEWLLSTQNEEKIHSAYDRMRKKGISFVWKDEEVFPKRLRHLENPPQGLFYKGALPLQDVPSVAVVGARAASYEGRELAKKFGYELAANGLQVISGMARGIDVAAQNGAMEYLSGKTYAVLGTGADICYPPENKEAYQNIQKQGGILSEFPPLSPPKAFHFPMRNEIISALSDGILVIEARKGSGSLITAELGLEQGKEVFVVPGNIYESNYKGGNELLKSGALLTTEIKDILDGLGLFFDCDVIERKKKTQELLETSEKIVYAMLSLEPVSVSKLVQQTGISIGEIMEILLSLQKKKLVKALGNHYYAIRL